MRFVSAQFLAYFENDLWKRNATHSNRMAKLLEQEVKKIPAIQLTQEVNANGVFAIVPPEIIPQLQEKYFFYMWDEHRSEVRWMTSFDTEEEDIISICSTDKIADAGLTGNGDSGCGLAFGLLSPDSGLPLLFPFSYLLIFFNLCQYSIITQKSGAHR